MSLHYAKDGSLTITSDATGEKRTLPAGTPWLAQQEAIIEMCCPWHMRLLRRRQLAGKEPPAGRD